MNPPNRVIALDPGEVFNGAAQISVPDIRKPSTWLIDWARTFHSPDECVDTMWSTIQRNGGLDPKYHRIDYVVEGWRNYGGQVTWSECATVEVIGAIKHGCRRWGCNEFAIQPARIKRPAFARMAKEGLVMPKGVDQHARDAVAHGFWYLLGLFDMLES